MYTKLLVITCGISRNELKFRVYLGQQTGAQNFKLSFCSPNVYVIRALSSDDKDATDRTVFPKSIDGIRHLSLVINADDKIAKVFVLYPVELCPN